MERLGQRGNENIWKKKKKEKKHRGEKEFHSAGHEWTSYKSLQATHTHSHLPSLQPSSPSALSPVASLSSLRLCPPSLFVVLSLISFRGIRQRHLLTNTQIPGETIFFLHEQRLAQGPSSCTLFGDQLFTTKALLSPCINYYAYSTVMYLQINLKQDKHEKDESKTKQIDQLIKCRKVLTWWYQEIPLVICTRLYFSKLRNCCFYNNHQIKFY